MQFDDFSIGHLARESGCKVQTIRYYEQIGLMPEPHRSEGNQRRYGPAHLARLAFIRHSRELGFPLDAIRGLLALSDDPNRSCEQADRIAQHHLLDVQSKIDRLTALKAELERMISSAAANGSPIAGSSKSSPTIPTGVV